LQTFKTAVKLFTSVKNLSYRERLIQQDLQEDTEEMIQVHNKILIGKCDTEIVPKLL